MDFILLLVQLIKFSPKRLDLFESLRKEFTLSGSESAISPSLMTLCPTRWTVHHSTIDSIITNYELLISTLEIVQHEYAAKAKGLLMQIESFFYIL